MSKLMTSNKHVVVPSTIGMNFFGIQFNAGAVWEVPGTRGTSHLMEHLMCKTFDDLRDDLRALGVDHNAYTSSNYVVFHLSGLDSSVKEFSQIVYDRITNSKELWSKEAFDNEKRTVLQEYDDTFNDHFGGAYSNFQRKYYNFCGPIGFKKDIEEFTYEQSLEVARKDYAVPRLICEVGESFVKTPAEFCSKLPPEGVIKFGNYDIELEKVPKEGKTMVGLISNSPVNSKLASRMRLVIDCLTDGLESPIYQEIRETRGLSYFSVGTAPVMSDKMIPMFYASTSNEQAKELVELYHEIFSRSASELISQKRFEICKKSRLIEKRISEILPYSGVVSTVLNTHNPFDGLDDFTYEDALKMFEEHLTISKFESVWY